MPDEELREWMRKIDLRIEKLEIAVRDQTLVQKELINEILVLTETLQSQGEPEQIDFWKSDNPTVPDELKEKWNDIQADLEAAEKKKQPGLAENKIDFDSIRDMFQK